MSTTLSGASDDLIELDGDIYEEFGYDDRTDDGDLIAFSNGVVLRIVYGAGGIWRITKVSDLDDLVTIKQAPEDEYDGGEYTDRAVITGPVKWAVHGIAWAKAKVPAQA